jgi:hypothetical protein
MGRGGGGFAKTIAAIEHEREGGGRGFFANWVLTIDAVMEGSESICAPQSSCAPRSSCAPDTVPFRSALTLGQLCGWD